MGPSRLCVDSQGKQKANIHVFLFFRKIRADPRLLPESSSKTLVDSIVQKKWKRKLWFLKQKWKWKPTKWKQKRKKRKKRTMIFYLVGLLFTAPYRWLWEGHWKAPRKRVWSWEWFSFQDNPTCVRTLPGEASRRVNDSMLRGIYAMRNNASTHCQVGFPG